MIVDEGNVDSGDRSSDIARAYVVGGRSADVDQRLGHAITLDNRLPRQASDALMVSY